MFVFPKSRRRTDLAEDAASAERPADGEAGWV